MDQSLQHVSPLRYIHTLEAVCYAITLEECMGYDTKVAQKSSGSTLISSKNGKKLMCRLVHKVIVHIHLQVSSCVIWFELKKRQQK